MTTAIRNLILLAIVVGFAGAVTVLSLSDRAPAAVAEAKTVVKDIGSEAEDRAGIDVVDRTDIPAEFDKIGHAVMWGTGMLVLGLLFRRRFPPLIMAFLLTAISIGFELAQSSYTSSRALQPSDAVANAFGIGVAFVVVVFIGAVIDFVFFPLLRSFRRAVV